MRHEPLRELWLVVEKADHRRFLQPHDLGFLNCFGCRNAKGLPSQASLTTKIAGSKYSNNRFFPPLGKHCQLNLALLDVENSVRWLALRKDNLISSVGGYRPSPICLGEQGFGVEEGGGVAFHEQLRVHQSRRNRHLMSGSQHKTMPSRPTGSG